MKEGEWREMKIDAKEGRISRFWKVVVVVVHSVGGAEEEFERRKDLSQLRAVGCISCGSLRLAVKKIPTACDLKGWGLVRLVPTFKRGGEAAE